VKLSDVKNLLKADVIFGDHKLEMSVETAAASDLMSDLLTGPTSSALVLSGLNNLQVIRTCVISGVSAIVFVRGKRPDAEMIQQAVENDMPILTTPLTLFTACGRLYRGGIRGVELRTPR
jgi:hypothetical protein